MRVHKFPTLSRVFLSIFIVAICMFGIAAANVQAATFTVDTLADDPAKTACTVAPADCSLRGAIATANATAGDDTIDFSVTGEIVLNTSGALPALASNMTMSGPGASLLTVRRATSAALFGIFSVNSGTVVSISGLTISGGNAVAGGGISNSGTLTVSNSTVSGNTTHAFNEFCGTCAYGAGIYNNSIMTIINSTVSGNFNRVGEGGGINNDATMTISNSTLSGNLGGAGGGIMNRGTVTVSNSTLSENHALYGGGIYVFSGSSLNLKSSIVANNTSTWPGADIDGTVASGDYNFIESTDQTTLPAGSTHNITGVDPMLGPLQFNGGPTMTHALLNASPAIDQGNNSEFLTSDQRGNGFPRAINDTAVNDADGGDGTDIGAVESNILLVNTTAQDDDGSCQPLSEGDCTLREAIVKANSDAGTETIVLDIPTTDPGYDSVADRYTITLTSVLPDLNSDMSINGLGAKRLTVKRDAAAAAFRIFRVNSDTTVTIAGLTISGGLGEEGGGIKNGGALTITACDIRDNRTPDGAEGAFSSQSQGGDAGDGGAIHNEGSLVINFSSFSSNRTGNGGKATTTLLTFHASAIGGDAGRGGAIYSLAGTLLIRNSTFSSNRAGDGGEATAISKSAPGFDDSASARGGDGGEGGAVYNLGSLSITNTTITANRVGQAGLADASSPTENETEQSGSPGTGSVFNHVSGSFVLDSTIVANTNGDDDIRGNVLAGDYNLVEDMNGILPGTTNITGDPKLGPLADNGGPTMTHALLCGSPAIDQGKNVATSGTDQRRAGFARTFDDPALGNANDGDGTDIGAFELQAPPVCNTAPDANGDAYSTDEDTPLNISAPGLLGNDTDAESDTLTAVMVNGPSSGTLTPNADGSFIYTPNADFNGSDSFTYKANDGSLDSIEATVTITVNAIKDAPVVSATPETQSVQYSDPISAVTVTATDVDSATLTATTTFNFGGGAFGNGLPSGLLLSSQSCTQSGSGTGCQWTLSGKANVAAGTYVIRVSVSDGEFASTSDVTLVVNKEKTETVYTGDVFMFTAGPTVTTANVRLSAQLTQQADGNAGDITKAKVSFLLFKSSNLGSTPDLTVSGVPVDETGAALKFVNLGVDTWTIKVKIDADNGYWKASPVGMGTVTVEQPTNELRTSGGGWVADAQSMNGKGNFGFNVANQKKSVRGGSVYLFRGLDGFNYLVKNTSWQSGGIGFGAEGAIVSKAAFSGKCVVQKIDPETGEIVDSFGNYSFTVDVRDGDLFNPRQADKYAITVLGSNGLVWHQIGSRTNPPAIGGGNITVKAK